MTREEAKELLPIIQGYAEGKTIQIWDEDTWTWLDLSEPSFSREMKYRVKPQPHYRPFKDAEECWEEMQKHQPFGWLKDKDEGVYIVIQFVDSIACKRFFEGYTFADGEPFGIKEKDL